MSWLRRSKLLVSDDQWAGGADREAGRGEGPPLRAVDMAWSTLHASGQL